MTQLMLFDAPVSKHIPSVPVVNPTVPTPVSASHVAAAQGEPERIGNLAHLVLARYDMMARRREARRAAATVNMRRAESA